MRISGVWIVSLLLMVTGCGDPPPDAVPISASWAAMNLPIDDSAVVWGCTEEKIKIVHEGSIEVVAEAYVDYFEKEGWTVTERDLDDSYTFGYTKGDKSVTLEVYPFSDVGVIIEYQ